MTVQELLRDKDFISKLGARLTQLFLHNPYFKDETELRKRNHIVGFGVGRKIKEGTYGDDGDRAIVVYVREKMPLDKLDPDERIRKQLFVNWDNVEHIKESDVYQTTLEQKGIKEGGIPTDIQAVGEPQFDVGMYTAYERPVWGGISIGWKDDSNTGTIGCLVRDTKSGKICILSAAHVFGGYKGASAGDVIIQPGNSDGGREKFNDPAGVKSKDYYWIATFVRDSGVKPHNSGGKNKVDAGIAELIKQHEFRTRIEGGVGSPVGLGKAESGMLVQKTGRTSGNTIGRVEITNTTFCVRHNYVDYDFEDVIATTVMSKGGDSGSLLLSLDGNKAIGLLIGSSDSRSFYCKMGNVLSTLQVDLI